jgi:hypothetical protein
MDLGWFCLPRIKTCAEKGNLLRPQAGLTGRIENKTLGEIFFTFTLHTINTADSRLPI